MESGYRECEERYLQSHFGYAQQRGVVGEHTGHEVGKEVAQNEAEGGDAYGAHDVQFQCPDDAVELTGAVVVAHDGLHALVESVHNHHEEHQHAVHDAVGADGDIAARFLRALLMKMTTMLAHTLSRKGAMPMESTLRTMVPMKRNVPRLR